MVTTEPATPRQQLYNFAHRILKQDAHTEPGLWNIITGDRGYGYLETRWRDAAEGVESHPKDGMLWVEPIRQAGLDICMLHMPAPKAMTEPYYAAFVRSDAKPFPLRYFVLERSSTGGAYWAEWRTDMRIRGAEVPEWPVDLGKRAALPYPYAAAFVEAIVDEITSSPPAAASRRPAPAASGSNRIALGLFVVALLGIALLALSRM